MGIHRRAAKRDANETPIIAALKAAGATVYQLSATGVPDLLVCYYDKEKGEYDTALIEVKDGYNTLTEAQQEFMKTWKDDNVHLAYTIEEALKAIGAIS